MSMNDISMMLLGAVAASNLAFILFLLLERNSKPDAKESHKNGPQEPVKESQPEAEQSTMVGKSTFNIDDSLQQNIDQMVRDSFNKVLPGMIEKFIGDVRLKDVEFARKEDEPTPEEVAKDEQFSAKPKQMSAEQEAKAFEDVRIQDVEPDEVSAPVASGASMDDIEESVNIAIDENSSPEEKARAGAMISKLVDTEFMDMFAVDPSIEHKLMICYKQYLREEMNAPKEKKPNTKTTIFFSTNLDDFNPADLLK